MKIGSAFRPIGINQDLSLSQAFDNSISRTLIRIHSAKKIGLIKHCSLLFNVLYFLQVAVP